MNQNFNLSPGYISGLAQTDGSFFCSVTISTKHRFGLQFRPKFTLTADLDSKYVLDNIAQYFGCGKVSTNLKTHSAEYLVERIEELQNIIIPHFLNYPVFCAKLHAFKLFSQIVSVLSTKEKRTIEGRIELLKMALSMNITTNRSKDRIDLLFSLLGSEDIEFIENTITNITSPITDNNIAGIIDGDGSFFISFNKNGVIKTGFSITGDKDSRPLLEGIQERFEGIGSIKVGSKKELVYTITGLNQIIDILIPFMDNNPLFSERSSHYEKFKIVNFILKNEQPLTIDSKLKIVELTYDMNKKGKRRSLSKTEYINLLKKDK